ncbi:MAG: hypothetical protein HS124_10065 [Anaerolineales bacterium]|nr:hypothetical protein [Anaerolineales bacterium]
MDTPRWAKTMIDHAKEMGLTKISLTPLHQPQLEPLTEIPPEVFELRNLRQLDLQRNALSYIPTDISKLTNLSLLNLDDNKFTYIPDAISGLPNLQILSMSRNNISIVPAFIGELSSLEGLNLGNNKISELPLAMLKLQKLRGLALGNNPLVTPPPEIAAKGITSIREYFRQLGEGRDYLYEAKFIILGEGGAGKTTLTRKIENSSYQLQDETSTEGVDVISWSFKLDEGRNFRVNIWDFGGQEIYHTTHQFFLTKRSLYALVADTRKEDTDFYYWLNIVEMLSDSSPIIVVDLLHKCAIIGACDTKPYKTSRMKTSNDAQASSATPLNKCWQSWKQACVTLAGQLRSSERTSY